MHHRNAWLDVFSTASAMHVSSVLFWTKQSLKDGPISYPKIYVTPLSGKTTTVSIMTGVISMRKLMPLLNLHMDVLFGIAEF